MKLPLELIYYILDLRSEMMERDFLIKWTGISDINKVDFPKVLRNPKLPVSFIKKYIKYINGDIINDGSLYFFEEKRTYFPPYIRFDNSSTKEDYKLYNWRVISNINRNNVAELIKHFEKDIEFWLYVSLDNILNNFSSEILEMMKDNPEFQIYFNLYCSTNSLNDDTSEYYGLYQYINTNRKYIQKYKNKLSAIRVKYKRRFNEKFNTKIFQYNNETNKRINK